MAEKHVTPEPTRTPDEFVDAGFETLCAQYADERAEHFGAAAPPMYQSSTFLYPNAEAFEQQRKAGRNYEYTRTRNPTAETLEAKIARLEGGAWARGFGSGMGAITAAIHACTHAGAHVVCVDHCYGPTKQYLNDGLQRFGVEITYVSSCDPADFIAAIRPETKLICLESPTSGDFQVPEIEPITAAARERGIVTLFDNSWATPYFLRPIELGCDLVVHSATKYIGGHSDVVAGLLIGRERDTWPQFVKESEMLGATLDPFAAWLLLRGLRSLAARMERHQTNGLTLARFLEQHPKVACVHHPGLESHPQHAVARRQLRGYSSLFSFELKEQTREATYAFLNRLKLFGIGVSWGGYESLALGGQVWHDEPNWLIRLHVGLETAEDLLADIRQALED